MPLILKSLLPTPLLRQDKSRMLQTAHLTVYSEAAVAKADVIVRTASGAECMTSVSFTPGESCVNIEVPAITKPGKIMGNICLGSTVAACTTVPWQPPRQWTVHVVQRSHHDVGYTDLASHVIPEHDRWLDATIEMAAATRNFPAEARFRAVIEQTWSIDHYLRHAPSARSAAMLELLRCGDLEMTALFGNLTTELCGHETLARSVYHAFRLKREYGIPIVSAEHNDIPGFSWGLSQVLTAAVIQIFCPALPRYYSWGGDPSAPSFWDDHTIFGEHDLPALFWWEAPSGKRVLFWSNKHEGGNSPHFEDIAKHLQRLQDDGYPYGVLRWPVSSAARDNAPYIGDFATSIREWNERWVSPRLVCSTNARFYADLLPHLPTTLPVYRGAIPGQDYPVGAMSTAAATGVNRRNHSDLPAAEALATVAAGLTQYDYPAERLATAYEETLWHDEHVWGHHFPAGPTANAAELEKAVHAYRAAALTHDVVNKAMARIADAVQIEKPDIHLVVFNPLPRERSGMVRTPLRELDNCGSTIRHDEEGKLRGALLHNRFHVNPPPEVVAGHFDLIDVVSGAIVPYQLDDLNSPFGPQPYAAQRLGLGAGGKRYGFFEVPSGLARDLVFHAAAVPPLGYRTYRMRSRNDQPERADGATATPAVIENMFYRLELDPATGFGRSLRDKESGRELMDTHAAHPFGAVLAREPHGTAETAVCKHVEAVSTGPLTTSLRALFSVKGTPHIEVTYTLPANEKRLDTAIALLKGPTPLLETYAAFPFLLPQGRYRYEVPLGTVAPERDLMPGAYADRLTIQNWVAIADGDHSVLWSSHDAPVVSLGRLWPGRISPAHSAVVRDDLIHPPPAAEDLCGGVIYSLLTANNFGTNFAVSQSGALLFRYTFTSRVGAISDAEAAGIGSAFHTPFTTIFTKHPGPRPLPPLGSFLALDNPAIQLVTLKHAEDGNGLILRLWNPGRETEAVRITLPQQKGVRANLTNLAEEDSAVLLDSTADGVAVTLTASAVVTVRLLVTVGVD